MVCKTQKAVQLLHISGLWPDSNCCCTGWVSSDAMLVDNIAQKMQLIAIERARGALSMEAVLPEHCR